MKKSKDNKVDREAYEEAVAELRSYIRKSEELSKENKFLQDLISWKGLGAEYHYFCEHAHLSEVPELPFPPYVL